jgi:hypothetical protein
MKTKTLFAGAIVLSFLGGAIVPQLAIAGRVEPTPVRCYFFKGEALAMQNTCTYESWSWAGGGGNSLTWEDGVVSSIQFGLQGRGERVCPDGEMAVDRVCGKVYARSLNTLKRISNNREPAMTCIQLDKKSVCWKF